MLTAVFQVALWGALKHCYSTLKKVLKDFGRELSHFFLTLLPSASVAQSSYQVLCWIGPRAWQLTWLQVGTVWWGREPLKHLAVRYLHCYFFPLCLYSHLVINRDLKMFQWTCLLVFTAVLWTSNSYFTAYIIVTSPRQPPFFLNISQFTAGGEGKGLWKEWNC